MFFSCAAAFADGKTEITDLVMLDVPLPCDHPTGIGGCVSRWCHMFHQVSDLLEVPTLVREQIYLG